MTNYRWRVFKADRYWYAENDEGIGREFSSWLLAYGFADRQARS